MALKQASLFNFESPAPSKNDYSEGTGKSIPGKESFPVEQVEAVHAEEPIVVDEVIREVEIITAPHKDSSKNIARKSTRGRMKLSDMDNLAGLIEIPEDEELFSRRYYNIGAVSEMFKVNVSLIRFWENEFDILKPKKNGKGDRLFRPEDIKNLKMIYHLLREKKYTIEGAKDFIKKNKRIEENYALIDSLKKLRSFLLELKATI